MTGDWNVIVTRKCSCSNSSRKGDCSSSMLRDLQQITHSAYQHSPARNLPWCFLLRLLPSFRNLELSWRATFPFETRDSGNWKTGHLKRGNGWGRAHVWGKGEGQVDSHWTCGQQHYQSSLWSSSKHGSPLGNG